MNSQQRQSATQHRPNLRPRLILTTRAVAAIGIAVAAVGLTITALDPPAAAAATGSQSCVNGVVPLNPYVINCNLPKRGDQILGAAPDAGAIIACRHNVAC